MLSVTKECYQIYILDILEILMRCFFFSWIIIRRPIWLSFLWYSTTPMQQSNSSKGRCLRSKQARNLTRNDDLLMYELIYYKETSQPHSDLNYKHFLNFMCHTDCNWGDQTMVKITKTVLQCARLVSLGLLLQTAFHKHAPYSFVYVPYVITW